MVSKLLNATCCGTTCDKSDLVNKVTALEIELMDIKAAWSFNIEKRAKKYFEAGRDSVYTHPNHNERAWLNFKAQEL